MTQQLYKNPPTEPSQVRGESSSTIFYFMTGYYYRSSAHPFDVDDWERNRALLLCYPEWRSKLHTMSTISAQWKILVENWELIESKYEEDYRKFGHNAFKKGECDKFIRQLLYNTV